MPILVDGRPVGFGGVLRTETTLVPGAARPLPKFMKVIQRPDWRPVDLIECIKQLDPTWEPDVLDQNSTYMCTAFAVVAGVHATQKLRLKCPARLNPADLFVQAKRADNAPINPGVGITLGTALYVAEDPGVATNGNASKDCDVFGVSSDGSPKSQVYHVADCTKVEEIATAIQNHKFVVTAISVGEDNFQPSPADDEGRIPATPMGKIQGHAMLIVGMKQLGNDWYFKVQNSWGKKWGKGGFAYVPENYWNHPFNDGWAILEIG